MKTLLILLLIGICACNNGETHRVTESDSAINSIDSSALISDTTALPKDSSRTTVNH